MSNETLLQTQFAQDVISGLSAKPKHLSSKYFYDAEGSEIFRQIMRMDAYYLTDSEFEIFDQQKEDLLHSFLEPGGPFSLVEFGAGDGLKTQILLKHFLERGIDFSYWPIDISGDALKKLETELEAKWPELNVEGYPYEYFEAMRRMNLDEGNRKVVFFLGSNIGNFTIPQAIKFLGKIAAELNEDDLVLIGFDQKKDPEVILNAYNDPEGITREFNLNLLRRMNRELGANFDLKKWRHHPTYDPQSGETKSYLLSTENQTVHFRDLGRSFNFEAWESIWLELSQKYDLDLINHLAEKSGFEVVKNFYDSKGYYLNSLWKLA
ncbi:MAG: L-histidine N(alpha)-methyltransferase [Bacteroidota bacterium]